MANKRTIQDIIHDEMEKKAIIMCEKYCKYGEKSKQELQRKDGRMPIYERYCKKCPMIEFYN